MNQKHHKIVFQFQLIFISLFLSLQLPAQSNRFSLMLEYTPHFSKMSNELIDENYKLSHLGFVKVVYTTQGVLNPSIGLGWMNTGEKIVSDLDGQFGIEQLQFNHNYNYIIIPIGLKMNFDEFFFIHPEFGLGYNLSNRLKQITTFSNGDKEIERNEFNVIFAEFNKIALPIFLTIGTHLDLGKTSLLIGMKGYYNMNQVLKDVPRKNHSYGFGISLGLQI